MSSMELPLNDNGIISKSTAVQIKEMKINIHEAKELGETFSTSLNELNENGLPGTSNTSEFVIKKVPQTKSLVHNNVIISYSGNNDWNKSLPTEEDPEKSFSANLQSVSSDGDLLLHSADKRDNVLPAIRNNAFSVKNSKPDAFQLKTEAYRNNVKASMPKPLGGKQIYFRFRVQESLNKVIRSKDAVVYQCHICKVPYKLKFSLKRHFLRNHINPEYISAADLSNCKIPIQNGEIIQQFVEESKTPSGRKRVRTNGAIFFVPDGKTRIPGLYKCHRCPGIQFDLEQELEEHYSTHLDLNRDDIFPCNLCPSVFQRKQALSKHIVSHSEGSRKLKNVPSNGKDTSEKNAATNADDHVRKTGITNKRKAKSSSQYKLLKDKSYRKKDASEEEFYSNVSSNIADNLLNHVDGGLNQINLKISSFEDQNESSEYRSNTSEISCSAHTFSNYFDFGNAVSKREDKSQLLPQEQCLYATGLDRNEVSAENIPNLSIENSSTFEKIAQPNSQNSPLILEEKEIPINREICVIYICDVCKGTFQSFSVFQHHFENNHPNVEMQFVEIESTTKNPPTVPEELKRLPYTQPNGILVSCEVPLSTQEQLDIKCPKCETGFNNKNELYAHMFQCIEETRDSPFQRQLAIKPIKSSGWFVRSKQNFRSGCYRRNKYKKGKYYFSNHSDTRGKRTLPLPSKLRPNPCQYLHCESVFISSTRLSEHEEVCTYRFKGKKKRLKKKGQVKKLKTDPSSALLDSSISVSESSRDVVSNFDILDKDTSFVSYSNDHVLSTESQVVLSDDEKIFSSANRSLTAQLKSILIASDTNKNHSDSNCEKIVAVERNILKTSELSNFDVLRNLVRKIEPMLPKDSQVDDVSEGCVKRKELISGNSVGKIMVKSFVDKCLIDKSGKNDSAKSGINTKNENIGEPFTAKTKETFPSLGSINLPKIKEVVKEIRLAASSLPNLKKSNTPLTFLLPEANQNVELSYKNIHSPVQTGQNSQLEKESGGTNESQRSERSKQRKMRKPVRIMPKMTNETESSLKIGLSQFSNKVTDPCLTIFTLENNGFKLIENSGGRKLTMNSDLEIPKLPEKNKVDFPNLDETFRTGALKSSSSSENIQINTEDQGLSTTVFLSENKPKGNGDREILNPEVLISSVAHSVVNCDPSLLDDEKFALEAPDLINPMVRESADMNLSSNNGLNFSIIIPTGESPLKSQLSGDTFNYFAPKISADKPMNESLLPVSSDTDNVKTSMNNKVECILRVAEKTANNAQLKEVMGNKVGNNVSFSPKKTLLVNDNPYAFTLQPQNRSTTSSTTVNLLESVSPDSQLSLLSDESGKDLENKNRELMRKSASSQNSDYKNEDGLSKKDGYKKGNDDSSGSKKRNQEQFAMANNVHTLNLISGGKSKQLKKKVKTQTTEDVKSVSNENKMTEFQKKKASSKLSLNKKCDSQKNKGFSPKLPIENYQPKLALGTNNSFNKNEVKLEDSVLTSGNSAELRFLRMKRPASNEFSDQTVNANTRLNISSETDTSHNQALKRKKISNNSVVGAKAFIRASRDRSSSSHAGGERKEMAKKEKPDNEIIIHHNCPYCYRDFAYLSNFRRHLKLCPSRTENAASEAPTYQHLPKKNEVEDSMLNLLRNQSRQNQLIKITQKAEDSKVKNNLRTFNCPTCHKIYLSYFSFIQHVFKAHKMTYQERKSADPYGPSTSQGVRVISLEESGSENTLPLPEVYDSKLTASDIPFELSANRKNSTTTVESSVLGNKNIKLNSTQNVDRCLNNINRSDIYTSAGKTKTIASSQDGRNVSISQNNKEISDKSLLTVPAYGKGRGRREKSIPEKLAEKKRGLKPEEQPNRAEDISSANEARGDYSSSKKESGTNSPLLKEDGKALLSDLKSSPKNTLVNKLRSTLSEKMQRRNNLKVIPPKFGKKSETLKSADVSDVKLLEKDSSSLKSPYKKNQIEISKITDKTDVFCISQPLNIPRRGRKKSVLAPFSVKPRIRDFKQESNDFLSQINVPSGAFDNEPTPSTSYGPSRGRKPRVINISLDLSSELDDLEDFQQKKPKQKKKPTNKVCPICKQKFPTLLQRNRHLQLMHGRKRSRNEGSTSPNLLPVKKENPNKIIDSLVKKGTLNKVADGLAIIPDRSAYQRQCSKPLPPMKRKYQKNGVKNIQSVKRTKS